MTALTALLRAIASTSTDPRTRAALEELARETETRLPLTPAKRKLLAFLRAYHHEHQVAPTLYEMGRAMGGRSIATMHEHLTDLETAGYLTRHPGRVRGITLREE